jgi:hypothetical protein
VQEVGVRLFAASVVLVSLAAPVFAEEQGLVFLDAMSTPGRHFGIGYYFTDRLSVRPSLGIGFSNAPGEPELIYGNAYFPLSQPVPLQKGDTVTVAFHLQLAGSALVLLALSHVAFPARFRWREEAARLSPSNLSPRSRAPLVRAAGADETSEFIRQTRILWDAWPQNRPRGAQAPMLIRNRNHFDVVVDLTDATSEVTRATFAVFGDDR